MYITQDYIERLKGFQLTNLFSLLISFGKWTRASDQEEDYQRHLGEYNVLRVLVGIDAVGGYLNTPSLSLADE